MVGGLAIAPRGERAVGLDGSVPSMLPCGRRAIVEV